MKLIRVRTLPHGTLGGSSPQPTIRLEKDASGEFVASRAPTLLEKLLARSAGQTLPAPKRGRGRPRKGGAT